MLYKLKSELFSVSLFILLLYIPSPSLASDIVYVTSDAANDSYLTVIDKICNVYGLTFTSIELQNLPGNQNVNLGFVSPGSSLFQPGTSLILNATIFKDQGYTETLKLLAKLATKFKNVMFINIDDKRSLDAIMTLTDVSLSTSQVPPSGVYELTFQENKPINQELSGFTTPILNKIKPYSTYFNFSENVKFDILLSISTENKSKIYPVEIKFNKNDTDWYLLIQQTTNLDISTITNWFMEKQYFYLYSPLFTFIRNSQIDKIWHRPFDTANFTIDDPWLIEPYGDLNYERLLAQMKEHNFHTTIAFVPWNYNRNRANVIQLFKENPDYYSLSLHGNNHDHREFFNPSKLLDPVLRTNFILDQERDIQQALLRMDRLTALTGLEYDKVMIFPHGVSPSFTFKILKKYNFLGTSNSRNTPIDRSYNFSSEFSLNAVNMDFYSFPSLRRYSPAYPDQTEFSYYDFSNPSFDELKSQIVMDLFLDNPVMLYDHIGFFSDGISNFNLVADFVNRKNRDTQWLSIKGIFNYLYYLRKTSTNTIDILSLSNSIIIQNDKEYEVKYNYKRPEKNLSYNYKLFLGDKIIEGHYDGEYINANFSLAPGETVTIYIMYDPLLESLVTSSKSLNIRVYILRYLSDIRDLYMSRTYLGNKFIEFYYGSDRTRKSLLLIILIIPVALLSILTVYIFFRIYRYRRRLS